MNPKIDDILKQLLEANRKAELASKEWNDRDRRLEAAAQLSASNRKLPDGILKESYVNSVKEEDKKLKKIFARQQFWSSEVVRLSALLQAYVAYQHFNPEWDPRI